MREISIQLRENPLFTRAKQHLEIEPGSNGRRSGRRLIGSTANLAHPDASSVKETVSYLRLDRCSQVLTKPPTVVEPANVKEPLETIIMHTDELDALIGKRTKSSSDMQAVKTRSSTKSLIQTQRRQSELELIFQVRDPLHCRSMIDFSSLSRSLRNVHNGANTI